MRYCMSLIYIPHIISTPRKDAPFGTSPISRRKYPVEKRRAVGASLRVRGLYSPNYIHPNYIHPNYISPDHFAPIIFPQLYPARPFRPKNIPSKRDVPLARLYVSAIYIPHIISTPKNIHPA